MRGSLEFIKDGNPVTFGNSDVKVVQVICYIAFIVCIVLQILLQYGKISFETKWFEKMCESKLSVTCQKVRKVRLISADTATACENSEAQGGNNAEEVSAVGQFAVLEEIKYKKSVDKDDKSLL